LRIELCDDGVRVTLKTRVPCSRAGVQTSSILGLSHFVPLKMKRRGVETRIIIAAVNKPPRKVDSALLKAVARARLVVGPCDLSAQEAATALSSSQQSAAKSALCSAICQ
jgi:hypothetical protein